MAEELSKEAKDTRGFDQRSRVTALWDWIWSLVRVDLGDRVLEAGCGRAVFSSRIASQGKRYLGVDRSNRVIQSLQKKHNGSEKIFFETVDVTSPFYLELLKEHDIDTVLTQNMMEHLEDDRRFLELTHEGLAPGGKLIVLVPAVPSLYGSSDRSAGHQRRYDKKMLTGRLQEVGFNLERIQHMNFFGLLPLWWRNRFSRQSKGYFEAQSSISIAFHNLLIPLLRTVESVVPPPVGSSLVGVARKGEGTE